MEEHKFGNLLDVVGSNHKGRHQRDFEAWLVKKEAFQVPFAVSHTKNGGPRNRYHSSIL